MPPRRRLWSPRTWVWLGIATLIALRVLTFSRAEGQRIFTVSPVSEGPCPVVRVVSGDTLVVRQDPQPGEVVVRLLSTQVVPIEENAALAAAARQFAERFVARGVVTLRLDNHRLDTRGRYLAYVECQGEQLNEALLAAGLARYVYFPGNSASLDRRLQDAETAAQNVKAGVWK